jgi:crotonobetainyl-CoA:carnitine CoA-transferase CaiB-like acyl-CoA transferase
MKKVLEGIRVIDLTTFMSGPFASMILGDLGAEIIKVEQPNVGDASRHISIKERASTISALTGTKEV